MEDLAVGTDVEGPAAGEPFRAEDTIGLGNVLRRIRQNRVVRLDVFGKLLVFFRRVDTRREVRDVELPDGFAALTERLAFGRSTAGEGFREPGEHDGAFALEVGK